MPAEVRCPYCRAPLQDPASGHVASAVVRCPKCKIEMKPGDVWAPSDAELSTQTRVPWGVDVETGPDATTISVDWRGMELRWLALMPFVVAWTWGLGSIYRILIEEGYLDFVAFLFTVPALAVGVGCLVAIVACSRRRWRLTLSGGVGAVFSGVGRVGRTRRFPCNARTRAQLYPVAAESAGRDVRRTGIWVRTGDADARFGAALRGTTKRYVVSKVLAAAQHAGATPGAAPREEPKEKPPQKSSPQERPSVPAAEAASKTSAVPPTGSEGHGGAAAS